MRKNKGESLIESLLSMFFITAVLAPVSSLFLKTFKLNGKITDRNFAKNEERNMLEILKTKDYAFMTGNTGKHKFSDMEGFYRIILPDEKYKVLRVDKGTLVGEKTVEIKQTEDFYINEEGQKEYIFEIQVGDVKGYYFPKWE